MFWFGGYAGARQSRNSMRMEFRLQAVGGHLTDADRPVTGRDRPEITLTGIYRVFMFGVRKEIVPTCRDATKSERHSTDFFIPPMGADGYER